MDYLATTRNHRYLSTDPDDVPPGSQSLDDTLGLSAGEPIRDALEAADSPSGSNAFATMADVADVVVPTLVDLGVILAADCTGGNSVDLQPLINAPVGAMVQLVVANDGFVQHDSDGTIQTYLYGSQRGYPLTWAQSDASPADSMVSDHYAVTPYIEDGAPMPFAGDGTLATVGAIHLKALVVPQT